MRERYDSAILDRMKEGSVPTIDFECCRLTFSLAAPHRLSPRSALNKALETSSPQVVAETILQSIPYSGFPAAVEALGWLRESIPETDEMELRTASSRDIFLEIYGDSADKVRSELSFRHADLEEWIREFAYGTVMATCPWDTSELEFLAISSLLAQARMTPFHSHLRGALSCGAIPEKLHDLLDHLQDVAQPEALDTARKLLTKESRRQ